MDSVLYYDIISPLGPLRGVYNMDILGKGVQIFGVRSGIYTRDKSVIKDNSF